MSDYNDEQSEETIENSNSDECDIESVEENTTPSDVNDSTINSWIEDTTDTTESVDTTKNMQQEAQHTEDALTLEADLNSNINATTDDLNGDLPNLNETDSEIEFVNDQDGKIVGFKDINESSFFSATYDTNGEIDGFREKNTNRSFVFTRDSDGKVDGFKERGTDLLNQEKEKLMSDVENFMGHNLDVAQQEHLNEISAISSLCMLGAVAAATAVKMIIQTFRNEENLNE